MGVRSPPEAPGLAEFVFVGGCLFSSPFASRSEAPAATMSSVQLLSEVHEDYLNASAEPPHCDRCARSYYESWCDLDSPLTLTSLHDSVCCDLPPNADREKERWLG